MEAGWPSLKAEVSFPDANGLRAKKKVAQVLNHWWLQIDPSIFDAPLSDDSPTTTSDLEADRVSDRPSSS
jgi:hypothetical protein